MSGGRAISGLTLVVGVTAGVARAAEPLTLDEVRGRAVQQAIAVEQARASRDLARAGSGGARGELLPSVVGFGSLSTGAGLTAFGFERPASTQLGAGLQGTWTLLDPASWSAAAAARQDLAAREHLLDWAEVDARRTATRAFAAVLAAQASRTALEGAAADAERSAESVVALVGAGLRPTADGAQARAEAAVLRARLADAEAALVARCAELQALLREPVDGDCRVVPPGAWEAPAPGPAAHPALAAAEALVRGARAGRDAATGARLPSLGADGTLAWYQADDQGGLGWSAGLDLSVPLFTGGSGVAGSRAAAAELRLAELDLEDQERALRAALASAEARLEAARSARAARAEALEAAGEALVLVQARYDAGVASLTALLDARRTRDEAAVQLAVVTAAEGEALAEVEAARGVR